MAPFKEFADLERNKINKKKILSLKRIYSQNA